MSVWLLLRGVFAGQQARAAASAMQNYKYDKAMVPESKNGGSPALNNNPRNGCSKRALLICLDLFCLFMGEPSPAVPRPVGSRRASQPGGVPARAGLGASLLAWGRQPAASPRSAALSAPGGPRSLLGSFRAPLAPQARTLPAPTDFPACNECLVVLRLLRATKQAP